MMEALKFAIVTGSLPWHELGCNSARETLLIQALTRGISLSFMLHQRKIDTNKKEERNKTSDSWTRCLHIYYNSIEASRKKISKKKGIHIWSFDWKVFEWETAMKSKWSCRMLRNESTALLHQALDTFLTCYHCAIVYRTVRIYLGYHGVMVMGRLWTCNRDSTGRWVWVGIQRNNGDTDMASEDIRY